LAERLAELTNAGTPDAPPAFLTVAEAAAALGCHAKTVRAMVARGELAAERVGAQLRVDLASLEPAGGPGLPGRRRDGPARPARGEFSRRVKE
jgi:excisionase family DNA binding protein